MPQVYFEFAHNPEEQLERSVAQYAALKPARPILVTGPTYNHNAWRPIRRRGHPVPAPGAGDRDRSGQLLGLRLRHPPDDDRLVERRGRVRMARRRTRWPTCPSASSAASTRRTPA